MKTEISAHPQVQLYVSFSGERKRRKETTKSYKPEVRDNSSWSRLHLNTPINVKSI